MKDTETKEEKYAVRKGGFYANLDGNVKGFTIFIIVLSIILFGLLIWIVLKAG